jgi:methionine-rich copper-binding protein CopC
MALGAVVLLVGGSTSVVSAHANLLRSNIKNNQVFHVGHAPTMITAFFAEDLIPKDSWINVFEGIADHGLVNEKTRSYVNFKNPKEMILKLPKLAPDKYYFIWYTHSADDHHWAAGIVYFRVVK